MTDCTRKRSVSIQGSILYTAITKLNDRESSTYNCPLITLPDSPHDFIILHKQSVSSIAPGLLSAYFRLSIIGCRLLVHCCCKSLDILTSLSNCINGLNDINPLNAQYVTVLVKYTMCVSYRPRFTTKTTYTIIGHPFLTTDVSACVKVTSHSPCSTINGLLLLATHNLTLINH